MGSGRTVVVLGRHAVPRRRTAPARPSGGRRRTGSRGRSSARFSRVSRLAWEVEPDGVVLAGPEFHPARRSHRLDNGQARLVTRRGSQVAVPGAAVILDLT